MKLPPGDRLERTINALITIGPAVLNGGLTTFLALALAAFSTGHVLFTFFKVFTLTVVFGLYHGLVVFPVLLVTLGPLQSSSTPSISFSSVKSAIGTQNAGFEGSVAERR